MQPASPFVLSTHFSISGFAFACARFMKRHEDARYRARGVTACDFDEDGDLFVTGRVDDMIISGGENISPVEIESVLSLHPNVGEAAVVGLPDERWGQRVVAFVKRIDAVEGEVLDRHCRNSALASFKRPREYIFVAEIPKSPVGKILRRLLISGDYAPEK